MRSIGSKRRSRVAPPVFERHPKISDQGNRYAAREIEWSVRQELRCHEIERIARTDRRRGWRCRRVDRNRNADGGSPISRQYLLSIPGGTISQGRIRQDGAVRSL